MSGKRELREALPFFKKNPDKGMANGPDHDAIISIVKDILACEGVHQVYADLNDEDAIFIYCGRKVSPQLAIEVGYARPDECGWDGEYIRMWWD